MQATEPLPSIRAPHARAPSAHRPACHTRPALAASSLLCCTATPRSSPPHPPPLHLPRRPPLCSQRESSDDELRCDCVLALVRIGTAARARASRGCAAHHELLQGCARPLLRALRDGRLDYFGSELAQRTLQRWEADRPDGGLFV
eukprot:1258758-Prymnesium_polylepis.1